MMISIIGLGYVGLPLALCLSDHYDIIGYDVDHKRVTSLKRSIDENQEIGSGFIESKALAYTS